MHTKNIYKCGKKVLERQIEKQRKALYIEVCEFTILSLLCSVDDPQIHEWYFKYFLSFNIIAHG